jgi:hypothetical protein
MPDDRALINREVSYNTWMSCWVRIEFACVRAGLKVVEVMWGVDLIRRNGKQSSACHLL